MTTYTLAGVIVILIITLTIIAFAWRLAVCALRDEAENIRQWRGEVLGND